MRLRAVRMPVAAVLFGCAAISTGYLHPSKTPSASFVATDSALAPVRSLQVQEALQIYQKRAQRQLVAMAAYSDEVTVVAEAPAASETAEVTVRETFDPPRSLSYSCAHFSGGGFINKNVITHVLERNVDHVRREMGSKTAILESNYKFSGKGTEEFAGQLVYRFAVKPRHKAQGLFRGDVLLDTQTGHLLRAEGRLSKSPSWWIKRIEFVQDYTDVGEFTMPVKTFAVAQARMIGRVVVTIRHNGYEVRAAQTGPVSPTGGTPAF